MVLAAMLPAAPGGINASAALPRGLYHVYFAVDYPMDGILHYPGGMVLYDAVTVTVE